jgi:hypothetical protein
MTDESKPFDPFKHAAAELLMIDPKDWRIRWVGPEGSFSTNISYGSKVIAKMMSIECGARRIV